MSATLNVPRDRPHPAQALRSRSLAGPVSPGWAATCLSVGLLVLIVSLSMADSLLQNIVPYERDTSVFYYPLLAWAGQQLRQGHLPLWTPQFFGGYPIFADGETGLAYPPVLLGLWLLPTDRLFIALRWLHVCLAAIGAFALARAWRLPRPAAVLAGLVFSLGSFLQAQIHHENIVRTAAWLPVCLALVEHGLCATDGRQRIRWTLAAAGALGLAGLSLHSQLLVIDLVGVAGYAALRWWAGPIAGRQATWLGRLLSVARVVGPTILLGLGLAAVQLIPLAELATFSPRGSGIPYTDSAAYSLTPFGLAQLMFPFLFRASDGLQWGLWTHWESYLYIGLAPLVLALIALARVHRREVVGWGIFGAVGLLLALGQYSLLNLHYLLWLLPGLSGLRAPGRFSLLVVLAGAMLAAHGLAWLLDGARSSIELDGRGRRRAWRGLALAIAASLGLGLIIVGLHTAVQGWPDAARVAIESLYLSLPRDTYPLTVPDVEAGLLWATDLANPRTTGALGGLLLIGGLIALWQRATDWRIRGSSLWPAALVALTAGDLLVFAWSIHPRASLSELAREPAAVHALRADIEQDSEPVRVLASPVLSQVAADRLAPFDLQEANGYSSLEFSRHRDLIGRVLYADDDLLDLWNVRYLIDPAHYGALSSYGGVSFLPSEALLHAPAGSALGDQTFRLTSAGPVSEIRLVSALMGGVSVPQDAPVVDVVLRDATGAVVAQTSLLAGRDTMEWAWDSPSVRNTVQHARVEVAGVLVEGGAPPPRDRLLSFGRLRLAEPVEASSLEIIARPPSGELAVYGGAVVGSTGATQQLFGRTKAKYREVYRDAEMTVLENTAALPRAFLVARARLASSAGGALGEMVHRPFDPRQEVVLPDDAPPDVVARLSAESQGTARVTAYQTDRVQVHTSSAGEALLVLTDTAYPGWRAFVDGQEQPVLRGDLLFRVVAVPAGEHEVEFRFEPASVRVGLLVSAAALAFGLLLFVAGSRRHSRARTL